MKILNLKLNFTETCSLVSDWQDGNIGSDNALVPIRRQAIIWSNIDFLTGAYIRRSASTG